VFTLNRRADAETEAFIRAIHRSAHCVDACCAPIDPPTVELPRIVATASTLDREPTPAVLEARDARSLLALVALLCLLVACLGAGLMNAVAGPAEPPASVVVDLTSERPVEPRAGAR
jgi:hypothetical protein